jgi:uncharacterized repeat protein (TIGR03837 family)
MFPFMSDSPARRVCDLFCTVIDNYGDIGVCWRLARQLAHECGWHVRMHVDDLRTFARLRPGARVDTAAQWCDGVEVLLWSAATGEPSSPPEVVIEAFACELPETWVAALARQSRAPVWINLEYLSAEEWVAACHLQPSPHPRLPLCKWFFFPGLGPGTGGVLRERGLGAARQALLNSAARRATVLASLGAGQVAPGALTVSLFAYENPAVGALLAAWRDATGSVLCIVPEGRVSAGVAAFFGRDALPAGARVQSGALTVVGAPFTDQDAYDRLLWTSDINFVRGEDSFVRAMWAGRPFVWQIYPQPENAHHDKLTAASRRIWTGAPPRAQAAVAAFWDAWNGADDARAADWSMLWRELRDNRAALAARLDEWTRELDALGDLAHNLARFSENQLK